MKPSIKTILVVDDAPGIRISVKLALQPEGHDVLQAGDAATALSLCNRQRVDLIILDMMLPGSVMGNDILTQLRRRRATSHIPIICMSGLSAYQDALYEMDPTLIFMPKPFSKAQLLETVEMSLKKPEPIMVEN